MGGDFQPTLTDRVAESGAEYTKSKPIHGLVAEKEKIAGGGEYNLSGERYRPNTVTDSLTNYPMQYRLRRLICDLINGRAPVKIQKTGRASDSGGKYPIVRIQNLNTPDSRFNYYTGGSDDESAHH